MTDWGDVFSKLSYWYGLQYSEIKNMPMNVLNSYLDHLDRRKAETKMMFGDVASLPHMKPNDRKSTVNGWMKMLNIANQTVKSANPARLKMMGIGVRHV